MNDAQKGRAVKRAISKIRNSVVLNNIKNLSRRQSERILLTIKEQISNAPVILNDKASVTLDKIEVAVETGLNVGSEVSIKNALRQAIRLASTASGPKATVSKGKKRGPKPGRKKVTKSAAKKASQSVPKE